jgi:4-amino-4-deoxy-L-arabinose transferase-like glycosyltransferase
MKLIKTADYRSESKTITNILLILVFVLAFFIRGWDIANTPALNPDEAALGYNAYSLLETGQDEHGQSWPIHFKSFGDFKPGGYVYLAMPFIKILGLTPLAVRLPNLILSVLTIFFVYKLVLLWTSNSRLSVISALVLTLNPWYIHFSRGAWESSTALFFIVLGVYLFYSYIIKHKSYFIYISIISFVASLYVYHSARLVAPLLVLSLLFLHRSYFISHISKLILPFIFGVLICLPVAFSFLNSGGAARFGGVGLTADQGPVWRANELLNHHMNTRLINRISHNKRLLYAISWAQKYTSHFDLNFLFINGDEVPRSKVPEMGQLYLIELPFLILGILFLLTSDIYHLKSKIFIFSWLFIAPIASSLTFQAPSALRALPMTIPLSILTALGIYIFGANLSSYFISHKSKLVDQRISTLIIFSLSLVGYIYSFFYYLDAYFVHYHKRLPFAWEYGFPQAVEYSQAQYDKYDHIYVTDKYDQPYILFLFFSKYDPRLIQKEIQLTPPDQFGFSTVRNFGKYRFEKINWDSIPTNSLVFASDESIPTTPIDIINFPNHQPAFKIYEK